MPTVLSPITCFPVGTETLKAYILTNYGSGLSAGDSFTHGTHNLVYDLYTGSGNTIRRLKFENRRWVDHNTGDQPVMYDGNGWAASNIITQTAQNPQTVYIKWYQYDGSFTNPYYDANWTPPPTPPSSISIDSSWGAWATNFTGVTLQEQSGWSSTEFIYKASHGDSTNTIQVSKTSPFTWSDYDPSGTPALVEEATISGVKWVFLADSRANSTGYAESDFNNPRAKFQVPTEFLTSGSGGSGSGANTLSGGSGAEIKDITFTKASDTIVYLAFNWQNVSTAYLFKDSGGTVTQTNISLGGLGQSGSVGSSGFLTNMQDGDKVWISNTDTVDAPYIHRYIEWSYDKTTGKVSAKAFFKDLGGNGFNQNADMALARIIGATYNHGYSLAAAQADPTAGHVNHDGTLQTMSLDAEPGTKWAVSQLNTLQYGSAFGVPKKSTKVSSNFW